MCICVSVHYRILLALFYLDIVETLLNRLSVLELNCTLIVTQWGNL